MIHVEEHVYHDDPKVGHPDVRTQLPGVCYYFIGNGLISAAVQHAPNGEGSPYGLLLMDPQQLKTKREALSFDPETGIGRTMLQVRCRQSGSPLTRNDISCVLGLSLRICRHSGGVANRRAGDRRAVLLSGPFLGPHRPGNSCAESLRQAGRSLHRHWSAISISSAGTVHMPPAGKPELCIQYLLESDNRSVSLQFCDPKPPNIESRQYWSAATQVRFESPCLDHLFQSAAAQLPALISRTGRIDCQHLAVQPGMGAGPVPGGARGASVRPSPSLPGSCSSACWSSSSPKKGPPSIPAKCATLKTSELDQNGTLLHVLREYALWTGDLGLIRTNWDRIVRTAEFPLRPCFREPASGLMVNQREYLGTARRVRHRAGHRVDVSGVRFAWPVCCGRAGAANRQSDGKRSVGGRRRSD